MTRPIFFWPREHWGATGGMFRLSSMNLISSALFSAAVSPYGPIDQRWTADISMPAKDELEWRKLSALVSRLRGTSGLLRMGDVFRVRPAFDLSVTTTKTGFQFTDGTGFVDGYLPPQISVDEAASASAESFVVRSLPASTSAVLRMGDLIEIRPNGIPTPYGNLYEVVADAPTNANGKTRISIEPTLRIAIVPGDMVVIREATTVFRLAKDSEGSISRELPALGRLGLSLVEETRIP